MAVRAIERPNEDGIRQRALLSKALLRRTPRFRVRQGRGDGRDRKHTRQRQGSHESRPQTDVPAGIPDHRPIAVD